MDSAPAPEDSGSLVGNAAWPLTPELLQKAAEEDEKRRQTTARRQREAQQRALEERTKRRKELQSALHDETPDAGPSERIAVDLAAHEAVLAERLGELQLALADRMAALLDNPKYAVMLSRALREVTNVRAVTTRRAQELLMAAANLRIQRRFDGPRGLA